MLRSSYDLWPQWRHFGRLQDLFTAQMLKQQLVHFWHYYFKRIHRSTCECKTCENCKLSFCADSSFCFEFLFESCSNVFFNFIHLYFPPLLHAKVSFSTFKNSLNQFTNDEIQYSTILVVRYVNVGIESSHNLEFDTRTRDNVDNVMRMNIIGNHDIESFMTCQAQCVSILTVEILEGNDLKW